MQKRRKCYPAVIAAVSVMALAGCSGTEGSVRGHSGGFDAGQTEDSPTGGNLIQGDREAGSTGSETQRAEDGSSAEAGQPSASGASAEVSSPSVSDESEAWMVAAPRLPQTGRSLDDFVPEGWLLLDSVEMDFNRDGNTDFVGVQEADSAADEEAWRSPRILFAVSGDGAGQYRLDFQDENLIRTRSEGGVFGDPYEPLTAEGTAFTTHSYGGSAWRWSEDYTYEYMEGTWYLTLSETAYGYGGYTTDYRMDDWKSGVGIREVRSSEFSDMEEHWDEEPECDLAYEIPLDEMITLQQAGMRWWLAPDRVADWEVKSVEFAGNVELAEDRIEYPGQNTWFYYQDEDCVIYKIRNQEEGREYAAMYRWQDRKLIILAEVAPGADGFELYKDNMYYASEIVENIKYRTVKDGKECAEEAEDTVGVRLNRIMLDGTGSEAIFEYRYPGSGQEILDKRPPYLSLIYEISGDEIVAEVYIGNEPHPFYRMNADGTNQQRMGQVPKE